MNVLTILMFFIQTVICEYDKRVITTLKYSRYSITPTVVNGKPAQEGQFPFLVSFKEPAQKMEPDKIVWKNFCGGSIISEHKVLTAAHCFESNNFHFARYPSIVRVVGGDLSTDIINSGNPATSPENQWRMMQKVFIHEHFNFPSNDIAVVFVNIPWSYSQNVNFIRLAQKAIDYVHQCVSAGYGRLGHRTKDTISPILLTAQITTMPRWRCSLVWEINMNSYICTESALTDVAMGDSGGPLMCTGTGDPNEVNNEGILAGIVSGKNFDKTTLYTRVSAYTDWIARSASSDSKLRVPVNVCSAIILFILIYLLFY